MHHRMLIRSLALAAGVTLVAGCGGDDGGTTGGTTADTEPGSTGPVGSTGDATTLAPTTGDAPTSTTGGESTGGDASSTDASTGGEAVCGDSVVQAGEDCDDGNVVYMVRIGPCCSNSIFYVS